MFEGKNSIRKDLIDFIKDNELIGGTYSLNDVLTYATLIETRIQNNLVLLNNPTLCSQYGISPEDLYVELVPLMKIRQKISFDDKQNKKTR